jgi:hypothetical protein
LDHASHGEESERVISLKKVTQATAVEQEAAGAQVETVEHEASEEPDDTDVFDFKSIRGNCVASKFKTLILPMFKEPHKVRFASLTAARRRELIKLAGENQLFAWSCGQHELTISNRF